MAKAPDRQDEKIIAALLSCPTIRAAAKVCHVSEAKIYERLKTHEFNDKYDEARRDILRQSAAYIQGNVNDAIKKIREIMDDPNAAPQTQLNAAEAIIRNSVKLTELTDVLSDLAELKKAVFPE